MALKSLVLSDEQVQRLGDGHAIVLDDVFDGPQVAAWRAQVEEMDASGALRPAGMGASGILRPEQRGDRTAWMDGEDARWSALWSWFEDAREPLNRATWLGLRRFTVQVARYDGDGQRYARHVDAVQRGAARRLTLLLYLNGAWQPAHGGCLRVHGADGHHDVEPLGGRVVIFLAHAVAHEVLPAHAPRVAITAWYEAG